MSAENHPPEVNLSNAEEVQVILRISKISLWLANLQIRRLRAIAKQPSEVSIAALSSNKARKLPLSWAMDLQSTHRLTLSIEKKTNLTLCHKENRKSKKIGNDS